MRRGRITAALVLTGALALATALGALAVDGPAVKTYSVLYQARLLASQRAVRVTVRLGSGARHVRTLRFRIDPERHYEFRGDGQVDVGTDTVEWQPPPAGGALRYTFRIDHLRDARSYDARCAGDWAIFRGDDLVPPARVRAEAGAEARARLRFSLPQGWSVVTPYARAADGSFTIEHPRRRFDRPVGWMVAGKLGVVRERVAGARIAVAGPTGHGLRRLDILAMLRWTLPTLREIARELPDRILVVGAGDPMWRGGLSGPKSVFLHADRPLIANDGTSPLLHELVHTVMRARAGPGDDWIVEGLAEYYSLQVLTRSRTLSRKRYEKALRRLEARGRSVQDLSAAHASGDVTARAVIVLRDLDRRIREATAGERSLDDVLRLLVQSPDVVTTARLRAVAEQVSGTSLASFFRQNGLGRPS